MKTRRDFLAGIGLGVSTLALPSLASARGRRRQTRCCECGQTDSCQCGLTSAQFRRDSYRQTVCQLALISQVGTVYYYHCCYCPGCQSYCTAPSNNGSLFCPDPCSNLRLCIGYTGFGP